MEKKIIMIVSVIIVLIVAGIFAFNIYQINLLIGEINSINEAIEIEDIDSNSVNEKLETIKTKGKYAHLEKGIKTYFKDFFNSCTKLDKIANEEELTNILSSDNFKEDGPNFVKTKEYINNTKAELEQLKAGLLEFFTKEKLNSYFTNVNSKVMNMLTIEIIENEEFKMNQKDIEISMNECIDIMDQSEEIIDFLKENKGKWEIDQDTLVFYNTKLMNQYNSLIEKLNENSSENR